MSEAINIALSGLNDSAYRITNAAVNLVNASSTKNILENSQNQASAFIPNDVITISDSVANNALGVHSTFRARDAAPNVDMATEIINLKMAEITYRANAAVVKAAINNDKRLLDVFR